MKVYLNPQFNARDRGDGGIRRVCEAQKHYLPDYGITFVETPEEADVVNCHATNWVYHPAGVLSIHGLHWREDHWDAKWAYDTNVILVEALRQARVVTVPSEWVANVLRRGMLIDPVVIGHGIELNEWVPAESRGYVLWNKNRSDAACNPAVVSNLSALCPDQKFITTFGIENSNTTVIGKLPFDSMKEYVREAAVYLSTPRETFGTGMLEAMACGIPVLGWRWAGQEELITHGEDGYLAAPNDYNDLQEGLYFCLANRARLGANARQKVREHYQWKQVIGNYAQAYQQALEKSKFLVKVSIIMPCYNMGRYLERAVHSIIEQPLTDWEIIIVNDASLDDSGQIADRLAAEDPRIRVIHNSTNLHVSESRNIGMRQARGEFVMAFDPDDQLGSDALGILTRSLEANPSIQIATGSMQVVDEKGNTREEIGEQGISAWPPNEISYQGQITHQNQLPYASLMRKHVFERLGGYRRRIRTGVEDADFWTRAMSFGFRARKVSQHPTLIYTMRHGSLSQINKAEDWLKWFPWAEHQEMSLFGAPDFWSVPEVPAYNPLVLSVIIPVGPGHDIYLQDCLDSLAIQTFQQFEVIVVNDTGQKWRDDSGKIINSYLAGFPFIHIIDGAERRGPAAARNEGIRRSHTSLFVTLDADDYAQPTFLELLFKAYRMAGGWIYCDWFADNGKEYYHDKAKDWSGEDLLHFPVASIVGLYRKRDWEAVWGYSDLPAGEDWDFHLKLLEKGICGTRLAVPLFTYRYQTGKRREKGAFENLESILHYMKTSHNKLWEDRDYFMGCNTCGGGGGKPTMIPAKKTDTKSPDDMVWVHYVGDQPQMRTLRSKVKPAESYTFGASRTKIAVHRGDVPHLTGSGLFKEVPEDNPKPEMTFSETGAVRVEYTVKNESVDTLPLDMRIINYLKSGGFMTIASVKQASDGMLLGIHGIGPKLLTQIREAANVR